MLQSVRKAKERRDLEDVLVLHSDRGIQFVCGKYQELTAGMKKQGVCQEKCVSLFVSFFTSVNLFCYLQIYHHHF